MNDLVNISFGDTTIVAVLGYAVVFAGLILLMCVVMLMGRIMVRKAKKAEAVTVPETPVQAAPAEKPKAQGTAGELKLYDTDPKDAAMIMAIVADSLGKPINELRFKSIREVREDEI